jgi:hypothetical protein
MSLIASNSGMPVIFPSIYIMLCRLSSVNSDDILSDVVLEELSLYYKATYSPYLDQVHCFNPQ